MASYIYSLFKICCVTSIILTVFPLQGFKQQALAVSTDSEHRFELALQLGELKIAHQLAAEAEVMSHLVLFFPTLFLSKL